MSRLSSGAIARRVVQDIPDGAYVNLGIGMPMKVGDCLPADKEIMLHTENGMLGMGPMPKDEKDYNWDLINAGKQPVSLLPGGSFFPSRGFIRHDPWRTYRYLDLRCL